MKVASLALAVAMCLMSAITTTSGQSTDSQGQGVLSPVCSGQSWKYTLTTAGQKIRLFYNDDWPGTTYVFIQCFSYLRKPAPTSSQSAECWAAAQDTHIYMDFENRNNVSQYTRVPLSDVFGGSITATAYPLSYFAYIYGYVVAPSTLPSNCSIEVEYSATGQTPFSFSRYVSRPAPRLRAIQPFVAVRGQPHSLLFLGKRPSVAGGTDRFFVASRFSGCWNEGLSVASGFPQPTYSDVIPAEYSRYAEPDDVLINWTYSFRNHGGFIVCMIPDSYQAAIGRESLQVAFINVFGGNPAFYTILGGITPSGLRLNVQYTIIFEGTALDLRRTKDTAKVIDAFWSADCNGAPAFGVDAAVDLGPNDDVGHHVKLAHWNVTFKYGGSFKMCYKRYLQDWVEVPPLQFVASSARDLITNSSHLEPFHQNDTFAPDPTASPPTPIPPPTPNPPPPTPLPPGVTAAPTTLSPPVSTPTPSTLSPFVVPQTDAPTTTSIQWLTPVPTRSPLTRTPVPRTRAPPSITTASPPTTPLPPGETAVPTTLAPPLPPPITTTTTAAPPGSTTPAPRSFDCISEDSRFVYNRNAATRSQVEIIVENRDDVNANFLSQLAALLCIPPEVLQVSVPNLVDGEWETVVEVNCVTSCDNDRKLQYLSWLFSTGSGVPAAALTALGVRRVSSATISFQVGAEDDRQAAQRNTIIVAVAAIVFILIVAAVVAFVLIRRRRTKRRQSMRGTPIDTDGSPTPARTHISDDVESTGPRGTHRDFTPRREDMASAAVAWGDEMEIEVVDTDKEVR